MCFKPLSVTVSGNSANPFCLERVTFLTSIKIFLLLLRIRKSNLVFNPNLTSGLISIILLNSLIRLF